MNNTSLKKINHQFQQRFYLGMGIITIITIGGRTLFMRISNQSSETLHKSLALNIILFVLVNTVGLVLMVKPVRKSLKEGATSKESAKTIEKLPANGTKWILLLSLIYSVAAVISIVAANIQTGLIAAIPNLCLIIVLYNVFPTFLTYFYLQNIIMSLKKSLSEIPDSYRFEPQNKSIWKRVTIILVVLALIPQLSALIQFISGSENGTITDFDSIKAIFISEVIYTIIGMVASAFFIAKWFRLPVENLLHSIEKVRNGDLDQKAPILSDDEIGVLTAEFNSMIQGIREREFIRETFGKYISKNIAELIIDKKINLSGELRLATILTTDIEGYTGIAEKLSPHEVVSMLSEYFTDLITAINHNDGMVNKFIGDAVVALFNVPLDDPDHAHKSLLTALEIHKVTTNKRYHKGIYLKTRIGINTGLVVAGNIGSLDRYDYTVIGDEVNVASRLEALNKTFGTSILIGQNTYELVRDKFNCTSMGNHLLKGKSSPLEVYKVNL